MISINYKLYLSMRIDNNLLSFPLLIIRKYNNIYMGCGAQSSSKQGQADIIVPEGVRRYIRKQFIGKGTYGQVYKCEDSITNQIFAMKVIKISSKTKQQATKQIAQLKSQISMLKKLNHPNIVKYQSFDVTPDLNQVQIVMQLVKGGTLKQYIQKNGPLPETKSAQIGAKILKALVYLHQQSIIHRDLKCANVLVSEQLQPKISDFGTAKTIYTKDTDDIAKMSASLKGTPYYMAPEVIKRTGHNQSADIWSFGCMMIQILSGKAPWTTLGAKFSQIINYISSGVHPPFPPKISKQCTFFLQSCLDPIPSKRLAANQLLKHRFIDKTNGIFSNKKDRQRKQSMSKPNSKAALLGDTLQLQGIQNDKQFSSVQQTVRKNAPTKNISQNILKDQAIQTNQNIEPRKHTRKQSNRPIKKHTQKYLNQINRLDLLQAEMHQVSISDQQMPKDRYYIKKTLANLKNSKNGKAISKTSTTMKNTQQNLAFLSSSQAIESQQLRTHTQMSRQQQAINTMISRAQRDRYMQQKMIIQRQRQDQKKKWEQQLKQGAQMLKKQFSSRYMYKGT